jgi:uncharacterized protein CbrC (UPF0167 family)
MPDALPHFRYHPDPVASGSVEASAAACRSCGRARGWLYVGPVYSEDDLDSSFCPWCLADGSAAARFDASFIDDAGFDAALPTATVDELLHRTPGFASVQPESWPPCCGDATAFIGPMGIAELRRADHTLEGPLMAHIVHGLGISGGAARRLAESLQRDQSPTLMLFRCRHCEAPHFHVDMP